MNTDPSASQHPYYGFTLTLISGLIQIVVKTIFVGNVDFIFIIV